MVSQLSDRMKMVHFRNASVFSESLLIHSPILNSEAAGTEERQVLMASSFRYETRENRRCGVDSSDSLAATVRQS